ncbi:PREDICTED: uncharacterized protein LOC104816367 [Tarenaya hassleriana]|uniref:uncharacterized protein LOC104816367 n=1 Tax=Tarenaya hassleriana TaxID=28532 RepID=UPI00053C844F|nr:PREDICTED: uncharacterized protein LOC104816367 [Tarenaya hassleriana]
MASKKHLKDLLQEDQEPFQLQSYISDHRCQIKRPPSPGTDLQVRKRRPISQNAGLPSRFCRNACLFSFRESPDPRKSPLFEFRSPNRSPNAIFLNIPAKTAAILLEAAVRIQKQSSSKTRTRNAGNAFGLFGSVLKKLTNRKKREIGGGDCDSGRVSVKDILRWESPVVRKIITGNAKRKGAPTNAVAMNEGEKRASETRFSRRSGSSGVWSESNEGGSWDCDFETSNRSQSDGSDELTRDIMDGGDFFEDYGKRFSESPFRFVLQTNPESPCGFETPNFASPAASPRHGGEKRHETEKMEMEEEEEKEQSSPVSVLDPPFQDDDEDIHMHSNSIPSSFRSVQRAKHQLLQKLRRFERLAGLDPVVLDKQMSSDQETEEDDGEEENATHSHRCCREITRRVLETFFQELKRVPGDILSLVSDIVAEEVQENGFLIETEAVAERVCERLESWRDVESNTIDMMVEQDFRTQIAAGFWTRNDREVRETAMEIEFSIFRCLVEEFSEEMVKGW